MAAKVGKAITKPKMSWTLISVVAIFIFISIIYAQQELRTGVTWSEALDNVWHAKDFWIGMMLPLVVFLTTFPWLMYWVDRKYITKPNEAGRPSPGVFGRVRAVALAGCVIYLVQTGFMFSKAYSQTGSLSDALGKTGLMLVYGVFIGIVGILAIAAPSEEKIRAAETGDFSRVYDERYEEVVHLSAKTTLWAVIALLFIGGSLVDMLVYRTMPIRAWIEGFAVLLVWQLAYSYWNKRI